VTSEGSTCFLFFFGDGGEGARKKETKEKKKKKTRCAIPSLSTTGHAFPVPTPSGRSLESSLSAHLKEAREAHDRWERGNCIRRQPRRRNDVVSAIDAASAAFAGILSPLSFHAFSFLSSRFWAPRGQRARDPWGGAAL